MEGTAGLHTRNGIKFETSPVVGGSSLMGRHVHGVQWVAWGCEGSAPSAAGCEAAVHVKSSESKHKHNTDTNWYLCKNVFRFIFRVFCSKFSSTYFSFCPSQRQS